MSIDAVIHRVSVSVSGIRRDYTDIEGVLLIMRSSELMVLREG